MSNATDNDRIERFKADVAGGQTKTSSSAGEMVGAVLGIVLMVVGIVLSFGMYIQSTNEGVGKGTTNEILIAQMNQNQEQTLAIAAVGLIFVGAALFLRSALMRFWRFWMLRQLYQNRADLDEIVEAIKLR